MLYLSIDMIFFFLQCSNLVVTPNRQSVSGNVNVSVNVKNTGSVDGDEVFFFSFDILLHSFYLIQFNND
jgi:hypothetical protein